MAFFGREAYGSITRNFRKEQHRISNLLITYFHDKESEFWGCPYFFFDLINKRLTYPKTSYCWIDTINIVDKDEIEVEFAKKIQSKGDKEIICLKDLKWHSFHHFEQLIEDFKEYHLPEFNKQKRIFKYKNFINKFSYFNIITKLKNLFFSHTLFVGTEFRLIHRLWGLQNYKNNKKKITLFHQLFPLFV